MAHWARTSFLHCSLVFPCRANLLHFCFQSTFQSWSMIAWLPLAFWIPSKWYPSDFVGRFPKNMSNLKPAVFSLGIIHVWGIGSLVQRFIEIWEGKNILRNLLAFFVESWEFVDNLFYPNLALVSTSIRDMWRRLNLSLPSCFILVLWGWFVHVLSYMTLVFFTLISNCKVICIVKVSRLEKRVHLMPVSYLLRVDHVT